MKRIDSLGSQKGKWVDKSPATGIPGTTMQADWLNNVQEEIASVIESEEITLDGKKQTQLLEAILKKLTRLARKFEVVYEQAPTTLIEFNDNKLFRSPTIESEIEGRILYKMLASRQVKCQMEITISEPSEADRDRYWLMYLPEGLPAFDTESTLEIEFTYVPGQSNLLFLISQGTGLFFDSRFGGGKQVTPSAVTFFVDDKNRLGLALTTTSDMRSPAVASIVAEWTYTCVSPIKKEL